MKTILQLLFLFFVVADFSATAQQPKILAMNVVTTAPAGDTTQYGTPALDTLTVYTATMNIILNDINGISKFHVKLGTTLNGSEFLSAEFDYGISGNFGTLTYAQNGVVINLGLGAHVSMNSFFAEVQVEKPGNIFEDIVTFSNN